MGKKAIAFRRQTARTIRKTRLSEDERAHMNAEAQYEGSPYHKRNPGNFGLTPPSAPRPDKTLCDEAQIFDLESTRRLFTKGIDRGLVSESTTLGFPKEFWVVDEQGRVFEAMYGGSRDGAYHGYPVRQSDPFHAVLVSAWDADQ